jgi:hypothetical protein
MVPNQQPCPRPITGTSFTELSPIRRGFFFNLARHHSEFFVPPMLIALANFRPPDIADFHG